MGSARASRNYQRMRHFNVEKWLVWGNQYFKSSFEALSKLPVDLGQTW